MPVTEKIKKWFIDRNLDTADPKSQMLKLMEETGELAEGIAKNRPEPNKRQHRRYLRSINRPINSTWLQYRRMYRSSLRRDKRPKREND